MNINYQIEMERAIEALRMRGSRPRLLLHACCAPCSSAVLERLKDAFELTVLYYNPNIEPENECVRRADELARLIAAMPHENPISLIRAPYEPERFHEAVRGLEHIPEGGERCMKSFELRLGYAARCAAQNEFEYVATTLTISPLKNAQALNRIGAEAATREGVSWLYSDFKKKNGYRRSCELSQEYGLYRQDYCGCIYSKLERERKTKAEAQKLEL